MIGVPRKPPARPTAISVTIPAPMGVNLVDPAGALPPGDCLRLVNYYRSESGTRVRKGYSTHATGLGGPVRSIFGFEGQTGVGGLLAATQNGIWNSTSEGAATSEYTFPVPGSTSGYGIAHGFTTIAGGQYLLYCDEANGYCYRTEAGAWAAPTEGSAIGQIDGVDPATLVFVTVWKKRIWFAKRNSSIAYYLPVNQITGTVSAFDFGPQFQHGGYLVGLWGWTIDGGEGVDDYFAAISSAGDLVVYQGTDPSVATDISQKGRWYAGSVPAGRSIATTHGGDLLVLSALGVFPLSRLLQGMSMQRPDFYATYKIGPAISALMADHRSERGWSTQLHPADATLIIIAPTAAGAEAEQWVLSFNGGGWSKFRGLPMTCSASYGGKLYFGTADGTVCVNEGNMDEGNVAIETDLLPGFQAFGTAARKRLIMARPHFATDGNIPQYTLGGRADFDTRALGSVLYSDVPGTVGVWGTGIWGVSVWGSDFNTSGGWRGVSAYGSQVSVAMRTSTKGVTTLASLDILVDVGGPL